MTTKVPQLPLQAPVASSTGLMSQPWSFYFTALSENLPTPGAHPVVDGSGSAAFPTTIFQGPDASKPTPNANDIYFSTDTGTVWIVNSLGQWQLTAETASNAINIAGGLRGEILFQIGNTHTSFVPVGQDGEVLTLNSGIPVWQSSVGTSGYGTGGKNGSQQDQIFFLNGQTVLDDYTIPPGFNASSVGPITIHTGTTVTISPTSTWLIL